MKTRFLPLVAIALPLLIAAAHQDTYSLRLNVPTGTTYTQVTKSATHQAITGMAEQETDSTSSITNTLTFEKGEEGVKVVTKTTDFKMEGGEGSGALDEAAIAELKNMVVTMNVTELGEVTKTKTDGGGDAAQMMVFEELLRTGWNGVVFPKDPVQAGSKWVTKVDTKKLAGAEGGPVKVTDGDLTMSYEFLGTEALDGVTYNKIKVLSKGALTGAVDAGGQPLDAKINIDGENTYWLDPVTGVHAKVSGKSTIDIDVTMVQVKVTIKNEITNKKN